MALELEGVAQQVEAGGVLPAQHVLGLPLIEHHRGLAVLALNGVVPVETFARFQVDDVVGAELQQGLLQLGGYQVVGRADDGRQVAHDSRVVPPCPEGAEFHHLSSVASDLWLVSSC